MQHPQSALAGHMLGLEAACLVSIFALQIASREVCLLCSGPRLPSKGAVHVGTAVIGLQQTR